jgi:hypothetical protein
VQITTQPINYRNQECTLMTCYEISKLKENLRLQQEVKNAHLMSSFLSHEMLSPLKSINLLVL